MRGFFLGSSALLVSGMLLGCDGGGSGESTATPANPQAGLDAVKKLQGLPQTNEKAATAGPNPEKKN